MLISIIFILLILLFLLLIISIEFRMKMTSTIEVKATIKILYIKKNIQWTINHHKNISKFQKIDKQFGIKKNRYFFLKELKNITLYFFKKTSMTNCEWVTKIGLQDASISGTLTGMIWAIKTVILGSISHLVLLKTIPTIEVYPLFNNDSFESEIHCIISFRIGHVIVAGIQIFYLFFRLKRMSKTTTNTSYDFKT